MKAKQDFILNDNFYEKEQEIDVATIKFEDVVRLNEKGFIYPLTTKELYEIEKKIKNQIKLQKEVE